MPLCVPSGSAASSAGLDKVGSLVPAKDGPGPQKRVAILPQVCDSQADVGPLARVSENPGPVSRAAA